MSRPKNVDNMLLALKARLLQFDREHGISRGTYTPQFESVPVIRFIEDLKAIFSDNTKIVAPFYLDAIRQLEDNMSFVKPSQFEKLAHDAKLRSGTEEPESVKRAREMAAERRKGIFRCVKCNEVLDVESHAVLWNKQEGGYEHTISCKKGEVDGTSSINSSNTTAA